MISLFFIKINHIGYFFTIQYLDSELLIKEKKRIDHLKFILYKIVY